MLKTHKLKNMFFQQELAPSHMPQRVKKSLKTVKFKIPVIKLNKEMIVRKSMHKTFLEYMTNSSLSGVRFLVDGNKTTKERLMWSIIIGCVLVGFFFLMNNILESQDAQPTYMTLEDASYPVSGITFPAIAICNHNHLKISAATHLVDILYAHDNMTYPSKGELFEAVKMYGNLYDFTYPNRDDLLKFNVYLEKIEEKISEEEHVKKKHLSKLLRSLSPTCEETLLRCGWQWKRVNCSDLFRTEITQFGFCCVFNYYNTEAGRLENDPFDPMDKPMRANDSSRLNGLVVVMQAKTEEYLYTTRQSYGYDLLIFDRYDYADQTAGGLVHRLVAAGQHYDVKISPYTYYTVPAVRQLPLQKRGCKFTDEMQDEYHGHYSQSNCLVRCRMRTIERLCHCIPFFLPRRSNLSACTLEELYCLNKYSQKLLFVYPPEDLPGLELERENSLNCPYCMADCSATRFKVNANKLTRIGNNVSIFGGDPIELNNSDISSIRLYYASSVLPIYRLDMTSYWYERVSYLGGLCGLFTGFSMLSLAEIFYYVFIRFTCILIENFRKYS